MKERDSKYIKTYPTEINEKGTEKYNKFIKFAEWKLIKEETIEVENDL